MPIRELREGGWLLWRRLAIAAVTDSPNAFRPTLEESLARSDQEWVDLIDSTVRHPRGGLWIAEEDDESVGMVFARIDETLTVAEFGAMWVSPHVRGSGIGAAMLTTVIEWAEGHGANVVECWVSEGNEPAATMYQRHGFTATDEMQHLRDDSPVTVRHMHLRLDHRPYRRHLWMPLVAGISRTY